MTKRRKIIWAVSAGLIVALGWWTLIPKIGSATADELRVHVAPELLQPPPPVPGGRERYEALRQALVPLAKRRPTDRKLARDYQRVFLVDDPEVRLALAVLEAGAVDRVGITSEDQAPVIMLLDGLTAAALDEARRGRWSSVVRQMQAAYLLFDRMVECDLTIDNRMWTMAIGRNLKKTSLALAAQRDLPMAVAARLVALNAMDRHGPQSIRRVLSGDMQYNLLEWIPDLYRSSSSGESREMPWYGTGAYDPVATAVLFSDQYVAAARNAGLPVGSWSSAAAGPTSSLMTEKQWSESIVVSALQAVWMRIRMNTTPNSLGIQMADMFDANTMLMNRVLLARTTQDQVSAALAVSIYRRRSGRDPNGFDELIAAGLLQAAPRNHSRGQPLAFDLSRLFEWPSDASY